MSSVISTLSETHQSLFTAKNQAGLSFEQIATKLGRSEVWVAALFYGQAKPAPEDITKLATILSISEKSIEAAMGAHYFPERGLGPMPPTDALVYRLYEVVLVFGFAIKAVISEKFGDGIMSAIDFNCDVTKVQDANGVDRVQIVLNGKWLPYKKF